MIEFMKKCKGNQRYLLDKERRILENNYSKQDVIDVIWTYEGGDYLSERFGDTPEWYKWKE